MRNREHPTGVGKDESRTMRVPLLGLVVAMLVAGCVSDEETQKDLSGACQVQRCVCAPGGWSPASASQGSPVLWRADGSAACPEGLKLHRKKPLPRQQ